MGKPVGGRGKTVPYKTVVIRVPEPIKRKVEILVDTYRILALSNSQDKSDLEETKSQNFEYTPVNKFEAIEKAKEILNQKQSAKKSLIKLLQVLYGGEISL
jgi:hypothetical protein